MTSAVVSPILRLSTGPLAGKVFEFGGTLRVGRHPFNEISIADPGMSRYHCWILLQDGTAFVEDLASANGTFVNGERVNARRALVTGDRIRAGSTELRFSEGE